MTSLRKRVAPNLGHLEQVFLGLSILYLYNRSLFSWTRASLIWNNNNPTPRFIPISSWSIHCNFFNLEHKVCIGNSMFIDWKDKTKWSMLLITLIWEYASFCNLLWFTKLLFNLSLDRTEITSLNRHWQMCYWPWGFKIAVLEKRHYVRICVFITWGLGRLPWKLYPVLGDVNYLL